MQSTLEVPAILVESLSFSYGPVPVLCDLNVSVPRGEIWALIGQSGSGKSTFLQILAGLFRPSAGRVKIAGREGATETSIRGVVFQGDSLLGWLSTLENVTFPEKSRGDDGLTILAKRLLGEVGLEGDCNLYPHELSAGMRKRVEFVRALVRDRDFLLADEPFGTLDAITRRQLWGIWRSLREDVPRSGFLCTHDPEEAIRLCDAVVPLTGSRPATFGQIVRIPESIKAMPVDKASQELTTLTNTLVSLI